MTDDTQKQAAHAVRDFFKDPRVAEAVVDLAVRKRPPGWSKRSNAPYYKEVYALQMKRVVDDMLDTRQDQVYFFKDFPRTSPTTLYLRIHQSIHYLIDYLDTEDKRYAKWNEMISITRERKTGIRLSFIEGVRTAQMENFTPRAAIPKSEIPKWKQSVEEYLESSRTSPLHITGLMLTPDDIKHAKESLTGVAGILFRITSSEIKIIKTA